MTDQRLLLAVLVLGCFAASAHAEVCFEKQGFGCCGTDCGVFCANCASCDQQCEAVQGDRKPELEKNRVAFFQSIEGGKDIPIDTLKKFVEEARTLPGNKVDTTKPGTITFEDAFKIIDPDFDGDIGRGEFDNDKLQFKLVDFIMDDAKPAAAEKPATDTAKPATDTAKPVTETKPVTEAKPVAAAEPVPPTQPAATDLNTDVLLREIEILAAKVAELENP